MYNFSEIFAYNNWNSLTNSQRYEALQNLENYYAYVQNRPSCRVIPDNKTFAFGYYEPDNCIHINSNLVENGSMFDGGPIRPDANLQCFDTIVHEGRHAYQNHVMNHPELCDDHEYVEAMLLNEGHYFSSSEGDAYLVQPQERDAWAYGYNETMNTFQNQLVNEPGYYEYLRTAEGSNSQLAEERLLQSNPNVIEEMHRTMEEGCINKGINYHPYSNENSMFDEEFKPKTLHREPDELRDAGLRNIDDLMDAYKDNLLENGYEEGPELDKMLEQKRIEEIDQFNKDAFGEDTSKYINYDDSNNGVENDLDKQNDLNLSDSELKNNEDSLFNENENIDENLMDQNIHDDFNNTNFMQKDGEESLFNSNEYSDDVLENQNNYQDLSEDNMQGLDENNSMFNTQDALSNDSAELQNQHSLSDSESIFNNDNTIEQNEVDFYNNNESNQPGYDVDNSGKSNENSY